MKSRIFFLVCLIALLFFTTFSASAKSDGKNKKEQIAFRGVWVATIKNMDYPVVVGESQSLFDQTDKILKIRNSVQELKEDFLAILDNMEKLKMNAIIFQVSPSLDAFYPSKIRPWSEYLTGEQGKAPEWSPNFDLVAWMIEESHKKNIEFHAWFNPFRVYSGKKVDDTIIETNKKQAIKSLAKNNFARQNSDFVYLFDNNLNLDPGYEKARKQFVDTVAEFLDLYKNVDGIHIDDYFYPYNSRNKEGKLVAFGDNSEDEDSFDDYSRGIKDIKEWRRDNINLLVASVKAVVETHNINNLTSVKWGISPFAIWDVAENNPLGVGADKGSTTTYNILYADTRKWVKEDLVDYVVPQIYWEIGHPKAPYEGIAKWWNDLVDGTNVKLYIGHGTYKNITGNPPVAWQNYTQIPAQLELNKSFKNVSGSVFFNYTSFLEFDMVDGKFKLNPNRNLQIKNKYF
ncbi:MAG: glycoside hydrolase family 10 protein [Fusobacteriaceae bacterium]